MGEHNQNGLNIFWFRMNPRMIDWKGVKILKVPAPKKTWFIKFDEHYDVDFATIVLYFPFMEILKLI